MTRTPLIPSLLLLASVVFTASTVFTAGDAQAQDPSGLTDEALIDGLSHRAFIIRARSAAALFEQGTAALPALEKAIADGDRRTATAAAHLVTRIALNVNSEGQRWSGLNAIISDSSSSDWRWCIAALLLTATKADIREDDVIPNMIAALHSDRPLKQYAAIRLMYYRERLGLGDLADQAAAELVRLLGRYRRYQLVDLSDNVINTGLLGKIVHIELPDDPAEPNAPIPANDFAGANQRAATFYETPDHFLVATLDRIANLDDPETREHVKRAYRFIAVRRSADAQLSAAQRLGELGESEESLTVARSIVRQRWQQADVREKALGVIGGLGASGRPALGEATALLADRHEQLRIAAADTIAEIGPGAGAPELAATRAALERALKMARLINGQDEIDAINAALTTLGAADGT